MRSSCAYTTCAARVRYTHFLPLYFVPFFILLFSSFCISILESMVSFQSLIFYSRPPFIPLVLIVFPLSRITLQRVVYTLIPHETVASISFPRFAFTTMSLTCSITTTRPCSSSLLFRFPSCPCFVHSSCAARPSFSPFHLIPSASPLSFPSYLDILLTLFDLTRTLFSIVSRRARVSDFKFFFSFILFPFSILFSIASIFLFLFFTISQFATILNLIAPCTYALIYSKVMYGINIESC